MVSTRMRIKHCNTSVLAPQQHLYGIYTCEDKTLQADVLAPQVQQEEG